MTNRTMTRPRQRSGRTQSAGTIANKFWMVRDNDQYLFFRENRKPKISVHTSEWVTNSWKSWGGQYTTALCVPQIHRMFPGLERMRSFADAKLVRITIENVQ